ncbi:hypothetical protein [Lelliottia wanjuensis]|uniref:hypothetical protein n=1 Tax=Lelliottia wanjuensis TaxID=3050585 RepID=UPI00254F0F9F|nr:hypothetical protein [Lelliottia sp. V86_10]MDK9584647.1 hypothetical protein [Lelliottia sp. V86_10]
MNLNYARTATSASLILLSLVSFSSSAEVVLNATDKQQINALLDRWNDVFNHHADAQPQMVYADQVEWYGKSMSVQQVTASEQAFVKKNEAYYVQRIASQLMIQPAGDEESQSGRDDVRVTFVKNVTLSSGHEANYPAEFLVRKLPQGWRITGETDGVTRYNQKEKSGEKPDASVAKGKFDGKHVSYVWTTSFDPRTGEVCTEETECNSLLWSSDPGVAPVNVTDRLIEGIITLPSLDNSGRDRAVIHTGSYMGAWAPLYLYDIQQKQWIRDIAPISYNVNVEEELSDSDIIKPDTAHPGQVNVVRADMEAVGSGSGEVTKTTSEKLLVLQ